jgi:prefoldin subunit 5
MSPEALRKDIAALQRQIASVEDMRREVAAMREELRKVNRDADRRDEAAQG